MAGSKVNITGHQLPSILLGIIHLLFICAFFTSPLTGQERHGMFWNYTVDDGLPSNEVYHIHEDSKGYMWFATANGISRFDGYGFTNYSVEEGILDSDIFQIVEDSEGILYLYSISGRIYKQVNDTFQIFSKQNTINEEIYHYSSYSKASTGYIRIDSLNRLHYFCPAIYLCFKNDSLISKHFNKSFYNKILDTNHILAHINSSVGDNLEMRKVRDSIEYFNNKSIIQINNNLIQIPANVNQEENEKELSKWNYIKRKNGNYLFYNDMLLYYTTKDTLLWHSAPIPDVEIIREYDNKGIFIGRLSNQGLQFYSTFSNLTNNNYIHLLDGYSVSFIYLDNNNTLWISTTNGGIFKVNYNSFKYRANKNINYYINHLTSNNYDKIYFTDEIDNVYYFNITNGKYRQLNYDPYRIKAIYFDTSGQNLWLTDYTLTKIKNDSINRLWVSRDFSNNLQTTKYNIGEKISSGMNNLFFNYKNNLIWTTGNSEITSIHRKTEEIDIRKYYYYKNRVLRIYSIYEGVDSTVWLGTQHGVFNFNYDKISISDNVTLNQDVAIYHIKSSPLGLIFGTQGRGLYLYTGTKTKVIDVDNGLTSNLIESLVSVDSNELWVGTANGVNRIIFDSSGNYRFQYYSVATGLPSNTINDLEYCNGKVYVATPEGLGIIDPDEEIQTHPIKPLISEVHVNNQAYEIEELPDLASSERNLIIKYDCLDYKQMGNILYRYRMKEGDEWNETKERTVNLLRLPPGEYQFEVQARGADRTWSTSEALSFSIAPPIWQRYWFWGVISLSVIGLVYTYTRSRFREVQRQAALQQKVAQLERKALRAQMNPHFIFNVLHSIQGYISEGDTSNATRYVSKFARLIRASLNQTRMTKIPLEEEINNLKEYLDLENMRMDGQLTYQFHIPEELDSFDYDIPPMLIQPFLENSIKHGISPKGKGHIDVKIRKINQHLEVEIIDDGIGYEQSMKQKKEKSDRPSLGINIARERLSVLEGEELNEHISVEEIKDKDGNPMGTKIELLIKVKQD